MIKRRHLDDALDRVRFKLDNFPRSDYQPLIVGRARRTARRADGAETRWCEIAANADATGDDPSFLDVGANTGFFSLSAVQRGWHGIALESDPKYYRTLLHQAQAIDASERLFITCGHLSERTVDLLPSRDFTLFLSVYHHLQKYRGDAIAEGMLSSLWRQTRIGLFFESGQLELAGGWTQARVYDEAGLGRLLSDVCMGGTVTELGTHTAFDPQGRRCTRRLFYVRRHAE